MTVESLTKLRDWMIKRDEQLREEIKSADAQERKHAWMFDLTDDEIDFNTRIDRSIVSLQGERKALRECYEALNRFAIHPFVERGL